MRQINALIAFLLVSLIATSSLFAKSLTPGSEYYIILGIYNKALGSNANGNAPALSEIGSNDAALESYIFVAEESSQNDYVLLKQKSTGRYLAASSSNSYSVVFQTNKGSGNEYLWRASEGPAKKLVNKKNTNRQLGIDGGASGSAYVSVYYDKMRGSHAEFDILPVSGDDVNSSKLAFEGEPFTNAIGRQQVDYFKLKDKAISYDTPIDIHISDKTEAIRGSASRVTLGSLDTWLIFDNMKPEQLLESPDIYRVYIGTSQANVGTNCRVAIYLNGSVVIPTRVRTETLQPLTLFTEQNCEGKSARYKVGNQSDLSTKSNTTRSFILKRGYMATFASGKKGAGYSRVYVADHADLVINELPKALDMRISSVNIKEWQYISKKGWCSIKGTLNSEMSAMQNTWFYTWSADNYSRNNMEYVPIRQHIYWPSMSSINSKAETAVLSINEPEHSEQHESNDCSCGGTISAWKACTLTPDFQECGARIGSPAPTDASWLKEYTTNVDNMAYRCDFVAFHAYWGTNEAADANAWYSRLKSIYTSTKRPIWLTEWNNGANWTTESWPSSWNDQMERQRKTIQQLVEMFDTCSFIERYSIYNWVENKRAMITDDNFWTTPAGQVYRDHHSTFAYNASVQPIPNWWAPSAKKPTFTLEKGSKAGSLIFRITNPNGDLTETLHIERMHGEGEWTVIGEVTDRSKYDNDVIRVSNIVLEDLDLEIDRFRVVVTTVTGKTVTSASNDLGLLINPMIETDSKDEVNGWTCTREAQNGYTKASEGDTYLEVWGPTAANMNFDYYQVITELEPGIYTLSANVFNSTDNVAGATVNGAVGLYAQTAQDFYFAPVTEDFPLASDATELTEVPAVTLDRIVVTSKYLRVGIRNLGTMSARWAGGDNFVLKRIGDLNGLDLSKEHIIADYALYNIMPSLAEEPASEDNSILERLPLDASRFIVNPEANNKTSYGWEVSNVSFQTNAESYDSNSSNCYWNLWKTGAYSSELKQEVAGLPAGKYTATVLVRGQDTAEMTLIATVNAISEQTSIKGQGAGKVDGSPYPNGWMPLTTPVFSVDNGQTLTLTLSIKTSATGWWSADKFQLTLVEIPSTHTAIRDISSTPSQNTFPLSIFDISGRRISAPSHQALPRGLYIINGKKVLIK